MESDEAFNVQRPKPDEVLTEYERKMVETSDPVEAERLKQQIIAGFYRDEPIA